MANLIKEARYIMTNSDKNNNKYWYAFLYDDGTFETHWNRVGESPNKTIKHGFSESQFNSKCREKEKKGYKLWESIGDSDIASPSLANAKLEDVAKKQIVYNDPTVEKLIVRLSRENVHNILNTTKLEYTSDGFKTPLGVASKKIVDEARDILTKIGQYIVNDDTNNDEYVSLFNEYCMHIPQDIGRKRLSPDLVFTDIQSVQHQAQILDALDVSIQNILDGVKVDNGEVEIPQLFDVKLELVEDGKTWDYITKKFLDTLDRNYACGHLRPKTIYGVDIKTMREAFEEKGRGLGEVWSLFHGTLAQNCLSILKSSLQVSPPRSVHISGKLFGAGAYFSDQSSKSLNYSYGFHNGGTDNNPFMFIADVAMGKYYTPQNTYGGVYPKDGYNSTFAKKGTTMGLLNNEMVIYDTTQCNLKYLIEFSPDGK